MISIGQSPRLPEMHIAECKLKIRNLKVTGGRKSCLGRIGTAALWLLLSAGCDHPAAVPASPAAGSPALPSVSAAPAAPEKKQGSGKLKFERRGGASDRTVAHPGECSRFVDMAQAAGVSHVYLNGAQGRWLMVEATGGGCGWIDFDRDGFWDLYLNQGGDPTASVPGSRPADQLFRNAGAGRFESVTDAAGIDERGYGQGIAVGDFDNDGFDDIYVTNVGGNVLYRNSGDGTFRDVTSVADVVGGLWSTSAAWGDIDLDGDLDLYVCNYLDYDPLHPRICRNSRGQFGICHPDQVDPVPDECYLNLGDGTFRPVATERGLFGPGNKALGVAIADFTNDGWPDIFVANDTKPNFLFVNDGHAHFRESAVILGCAVNTAGNPQANMGVAVGDYDRNGWLDLYVTHFTSEWNTLYQNRGPEGFQDVSAIVGLVPPKFDKLGFGAVMHDFNFDGFDELFVANGHINDNRELGDDLDMICQLFAWQGKRFVECTAQAGEFFERKMIGRGVAAADYDNDGDLDLVVVPQNTPTALLNNQSRLGNWLKLEFVGRRSNRRGIGTRVVVKFGDRTTMQELAGGTSYCASHQPALFFGLGDWTGPIDVEVRWPAGTTQSLHAIVAHRTLTLIEPAGDQ